MAVLFFGIFLSFVALSVVANAVLPYTFAEDGFVFPSSSQYFPGNFKKISFDGNNIFTLQIQDGTLNAYFVIPLNESNIAHEIHIFPNNSLPPTNDGQFQHYQRFNFFLNAYSSTYWRTLNGITLTNIKLEGNFAGSNTGKLKIQLFTNGTIVFADQYYWDAQISYNFTQGNYFFIPFSIEWLQVFETFIVEMGNGIKLAFYEGQYEDPPKEKEWSLIGLSTTAPSTTTSTPTSRTTTTTSKIPTSSFPYSKPEFNFSIFLQQNFDLLIIIVILCFLILFCSMIAIFLCCCFKSK